MPNAPKQDRQVMHQGSFDHVEFKWEHVEFAEQRNVEVYPLVKKYFCVKKFGDEGTFTRLVQAAIDSDFYEPFSEYCLLFSGAV